MRILCFYVKDFRTRALRYKGKSGVEETEEKKEVEKAIDIITITRINEDNLAKILTKFYKIMYNTFPNLRENLQIAGKFEDCYNNFLEKGILEQGWKDLTITEKDTGVEKSLDLETLKSLINYSMSKSKIEEEKKGECVLL